MNKPLYIHHIINLVLSILLLILDYFNTINLTVAILLILLILINSTLLLIVSRKKEDKMIHKNSKTFKSEDLSSLPIIIFFIILSIHNILTKDSIIFLSFSILSLIVFILILILEIKSYLKRRRNDKDSK